MSVGSHKSDFLLLYLQLAKSLVEGDALLLIILNFISGADILLFRAYQLSLFLRLSTKLSYCYGARDFTLRPALLQVFTDWRNSRRDLSYLLRDPTWNSNPPTYKELSSFLNWKFLVKATCARVLTHPIPQNDFSL